MGDAIVNKQAACLSSQFRITNITITLPEFWPYSYRYET